MSKLLVEWLDLWKVFDGRRNRLVVWWWLTRGSDVLPGGTTQTKMMASRVGYVDPRDMIHWYTHPENPMKIHMLKAQKWRFAADDVLLNISEGFVPQRFIWKKHENIHPSELVKIRKQKNPLRSASIHVMIQVQSTVGSTKHAELTQPTAEWSRDSTK